MTSNKFKVGMVASNITRKAGGVFDVVRALSGELSNSPLIDVEVFSINDPSGNNQVEEWRGVKTNLSQRVGPSRLGYAPGLSKSLVSSGLDLVHLHGLWMYPSVATSTWQRETSNGHIISPHGMLDPWALNNSRRKKIVAYHGFEKRNLKLARCIHALNESEYASIRKFGLDNPVCIIPNGINIPSPSLKGRPIWREKIPSDAKILLYLGRIHPKKGLIPLVSAWLACANLNEARNWHLVVAGWDQGQHEIELKSMAKQGLDTVRLHFIGPQFGDDKSACYANSDAFVLPSFSEGLPMVVLEAWAYGLPVMMTEHCNLPEGFATESALKISPDSKDIEEKLKELFLLSEADLEKIGSNGNKLVRDKFTWEKVAQQFSSVYRWVLGETSSPDCVRFD